ELLIDADGRHIGPGKTGQAIFDLGPAPRKAIFGGAWIRVDNVLALVAHRQTLGIVDDFLNLIVRGAAAVRVLEVAPRQERIAVPALTRAEREIGPRSVIVLDGTIGRDSGHVVKLYGGKG